MWTTRASHKDGQHWVTLLRGDTVVAEMSLDDWAGLSMTKFLIEDQVSQAVHEQRLVAAGIPE
jgi:hypothetical protein